MLALYGKLQNHTYIEDFTDQLQALTEAVTTGRKALISQNVLENITELEQKTSASDIWDDPTAANTLFTKLKTLKSQWEPLDTLYTNVTQLVELAAESSPEEQELLTQELQNYQATWQKLETNLYLGGEFDANNCYVSITSGAGGTEAQDWAAMLARMYLRYCETKDWPTSITEQTDGAEAGVKSITIHVQGAMAYGQLKCEKGTHRLVRQSPFNAKNLRQTSFALVEVLPEITATLEIEINLSDLRVDTYRSSGAGGQHVNKTDSAVRITHEPTGIAVACQSERSQQQNRANAMNILYAKLLEKKRAEDDAKASGLKGSTKSADFGQQIRSYVLHPYQMVKDVRTNAETVQTEAVLNGDIQLFIDAELKRAANE